ncbi:actinohivin [Streptomyces clavuligerus]|nr:actinohivin [Streptomyces clavuligerus]
MFTGAALVATVSGVLAAPAAHAGSQPTAGASAAARQDGVRTAAYVGTNVLRNWETGRCLDSNAQGDVYTLPCSLPVGSNAHQVWEPLLRGKDPSADIVGLRNVATNRCAAFRYPANITTVPCSATVTAQQWFAYGAGWDNVTFVSRGGPIGGPDTIDSDRNGNVYAYTRNGGGFQRWKFGY